MGLVGRTQRDSDSVTIGRQRDAPYRRGSRAVIRVRSAAERPGAGPQRPRSTSRPQRVIKLIWLGCVIRTRRIAESKTIFQLAPCALVRRSSSFHERSRITHTRRFTWTCARAPPLPRRLLHQHLLYTHIIRYTKDTPHDEMTRGEHTLSLQSSKVRGYTIHRTGQASALAPRSPDKDTISGFSQ